MSTYHFQNDLTPSADPASEGSADDQSLNEENGGGGSGYNGFFEGPEKTMEVLFRTNVGVDDGLRTLSRTQLDHLCELAKCSILSKISSSHMDAYVLSESSLFVYKHKYIMKTCGTTTLLRCLNTLLKYADEMQMEVESVVYSRKNLTCPTAQMWPHSSFGDEIKYIHNHANLQERLHGNGYILGPVTGDHWFIYVADLTPPPATARPLSMIEANGSEISLTDDSMKILSAATATTAEVAAVVATTDVQKKKQMLRQMSDTAPLHSIPPVVSIYSGKQHSDRTINMMMFGLASDVCETFFEKNVPTGKEMTKKSGISQLCPGALIDEKAFSPCGYSMNAILHDAYYTVHITPEEACSYASFETNTCLTNYSPLVRNALTVFKPKRFVVTMFGDESGINSMMELPTDLRRIDLPGIGSYVRTSQSSTKVETECSCFMSCFSLEQSSPLLTSGGLVSVGNCVGMTNGHAAALMKREASSNSLLQKRARGYSCV